MEKKVQVTIEVTYDDQPTGIQNDPFTPENVEKYPDQVINAVRTTKNTNLQLIAVERIGNVAKLPKPIPAPGPHPWMKNGVWEPPGY